MFSWTFTAFVSCQLSFQLFSAAKHGWSCGFESSPLWYFIYRYSFLCFGVMTSAIGPNRFGCRFKWTNHFLHKCGWRRLPTINWDHRIKQFETANSERLSPYPPSLLSILMKAKVDFRKNISNYRCSQDIQTWWLSTIRNSSLGQPVFFSTYSICIYSLSLTGIEYAVVPVSREPEAYL